MQKMSNNTENKYDKINKRINDTKKGVAWFSGILFVGGVAVKKGWPIVKKMIFKA